MRFETLHSYFLHLLLYQATECYANLIVNSEGITLQAEVLADLHRLEVQAVGAVVLTRHGDVLAVEHLRVALHAPRQRFHEGEVLVVEVFVALHVAAQHALTRGLYIDGTALKVKWYNTDQVSVFPAASNITLLGTLTAAANDNGSTTLTGDLTSPVVGQLIGSDGKNYAYPISEAGVTVSRQPEGVFCTKVLNIRKKFLSLHPVGTNLYICWYNLYSEM